MTAVTLGDLRGQLVAKASLSQAFFMTVGEITLQVRSNSGALTDLLQKYFAEFLVAPRATALVFEVLHTTAPDLDLPFTPWRREPGKRGPKEEFVDLSGGRVVRKVRTGMQFLVGEGVHFALGDCVTNYNQVVNFINSQLIAHYLEQQWQLCHAAAVVSGEQGLAIAAASGAGKSTLALHLVSSGLQFTSNDRLLVRERDGQPRMAGIPKLPRVNPGTLLGSPDLKNVLSEERARQLVSMAPGELWELEEKYDVDIPAIYGSGRTRLAAPLKSLLVLTWSRTGESPAEFVSVKLEERRDLLRLVMKPAGPFCVTTDVDVDPQDTLDEQAYLTELRNVACYELRGRVDFPFAVKHCREHLL